MHDVSGMTFKAENWMASINTALTVRYTLVKLACSIKCLLYIHFYRPSQISTSYKLAVEGQIDLEKITEVSSASSPTGKHTPHIPYSKEQIFPSVPVRFVLCCLHPYLYSVCLSVCICVTGCRCLCAWDCVHACMLVSVCVKCIFYYVNQFKEL